ncbi:hypothetical protein DF143_09515 [Burkholderia cenocepacia]|nr:hypothetical protein DF143_09515 [Burkholderia cenocepacia]RQV44660.1 hypothetical protein DF033_14875 [Burkholderia cenocepacia]
MNGGSIQRKSTVVQFEFCPDPGTDRATDAEVEAAAARAWALRRAHRRGQHVIAERLAQL